MGRGRCARKSSGAPGCRPLSTLRHPEVLLSSSRAPSETRETFLPEESGILAPVQYGARRCRRCDGHFRFRRYTYAISEERKNDSAREPPADLKLYSNRIQRIRGATQPRETIRISWTVFADAYALEKEDSLSNVTKERIGDENDE